MCSKRLNNVILSYYICYHPIHKQCFNGIECTRFYKFSIIFPGFRDILIIVLSESHCVPLLFYFIIFTKIAARNSLLLNFDIHIADRISTPIWPYRSSHIGYLFKFEKHVIQQTASYPYWLVWPVRVSQTLMHWDLTNWHTDRTSRIVSFHRAPYFCRAVKLTNEILLPYIRYRGVNFGTYYTFRLRFLVQLSQTIICLEMSSLNVKLLTNRSYLHRQ